MLAHVATGHVPCGFPAFRVVSRRDQGVGQGGETRGRCPRQEDALRFDPMNHLLDISERAMSADPAAQIPPGVFATAIHACRPESAARIRAGASRRLMQQRLGGGRNERMTMTAASWTATARRPRFVLTSTQYDQQQLSTSPDGNVGGIGGSCALGDAVWMHASARHLRARRAAQGRFRPQAQPNLARDGSSDAAAELPLLERGTPARLVEAGEAEPGRNGLEGVERRGRPQASSSLCPYVHNDHSRFDRRDGTCRCRLRVSGHALRRLGVEITVPSSDPCASSLNLSLSPLPGLHHRSRRGRPVAPSALGPLSPHCACRRRLDSTPAAARSREAVLMGAGAVHTIRGDG